MTTALPTSLIECPACRQRISAAAPTCPSCGHPIAPVTIERTGKKWKKIQLYAGILLVLSVVLFVVYPANYAPAVALGLAGIVLYAYARLGAWWGHG